MIKPCDFNLAGRAFTPFFLKGAAITGRDIVFNGVVIAQVFSDEHEYRLYHTESARDDQKLIIAKNGLSDGIIEAEVIGINDIDVLESFCQQENEHDLGLDILHEICRQSGFPGYRTLGQYHQEAA